MIKRMRRGGFTLVELLVVIAIISVLAAILLPVLGQAIDQARLTSCMNGQKQVYIAAQLYSDDNLGFLMPPKTAFTPYPWNPWWLKTPPGCLIYGGYIAGSVEPVTANNRLNIRTNFMCPSIPKEDWEYHTRDTGTYGFNNGDAWNDGLKTPIRAQSVLRPSKFLYIADCNPSNYAVVATRPGYIAKEHGGRAVMTFAAGNVESQPEYYFEMLAYPVWGDYLPFSNKKENYGD